MNSLTDFYTAPAPNLAQVVLLNDASQMSEPTIKVLKSEERHHPEQKLWGREGFAYTVELTDESGKKSVRELYMFCSEGSEKNYNLVDFVAIGAEGDNFYKKANAQRWGDETVTSEIKEALDLFDHPSKAKKKHDLNGDEARARLRAAGRPTTQCKPN